MDPLSITAACVGILGSIGPLAFKIRKFAAGVREARDEMAALGQELSSLSMFMENLKTDCEDPAFEYPQALRQSFVDVLAQCAGVVKDMTGILDKFALGNLRKRLRWETSGRDDMQKLKERLNGYSGLIGRYMELLSLLQSREIRYDTSNTLRQVELLGVDTRIIRSSISILPQIQHRLGQHSSQLFQIAELLRSQAPLTGGTREEREENIILRRWIEETCSYTETVLEEVTTRASEMSAPSERPDFISQQSDTSPDQDDERRRTGQIDVDTHPILSEVDPQAIWATFVSSGFDDAAVSSFGDTLTGLSLYCLDDQNKEMRGRSTEKLAIDFLKPTPMATPPEISNDVQEDTEMATEFQDAAELLRSNYEDSLPSSLPNTVPERNDDNSILGNEELEDSRSSTSSGRLDGSYVEDSDVEIGFRRGRSPTPKPVLHTRVDTSTYRDVDEALLSNDSLTGSSSLEGHAAEVAIPETNQGLQLESPPTSTTLRSSQIHRQASENGEQLSQRRQISTKDKMVYDPHSRSFRSEAELHLQEAGLEQSLHNAIEPARDKKNKRVIKRQTEAQQSQDSTLSTPSLSIDSQYGKSPSISSTNVDETETFVSSIRPGYPHNPPVLSEDDFRTSQNFWVDNDTEDTSNEPETPLSRKPAMKSPRKSSFQSSRRGSFQSFRSFSGAKVTVRQVPVVELPHLSDAEKRLIQALLMQAGFRLPSQGASQPRRKTWSWSKSNLNDQETMNKALAWAINDYDISNRVIKTLPTERIVQYVIDKGADVNTAALSTYSYVPSVKSKHLVPILHIAIHASLREVAEVLLVKGAQPDARDWMQRTALHLAAEKDLWEIILLLAGNGANVHAEDSWGHSPLHIAATTGNFSAVKVLISAGGDAWAPGLVADVAAFKGTARILRLLLDRGSNPNDEDKSQKSALYRAVENILADNVQVLLDFGAEPSTSLYLAENRHRWEVRGRQERIADKNLVSLLSRHVQKTASRRRRSVSFSRRASVY